MADLSELMHERLRGRVCLLGVGNAAQGDDGFGPQMAAELKAAGYTNAVTVGADPETWIMNHKTPAYDQVVFMDAVNFDAAPGSVVFLGADEIQARFPQVSTHKLSLGLLARLIEMDGVTKAWLLGVQPASLAPDTPLSPPVRNTLKLLLPLLRRALSAPPAKLTDPKPAGDP